MSLLQFISEGKGARTKQNIKARDAQSLRNLVSSVNKNKTSSESEKTEDADYSQFTYRYGKSSPLDGISYSEAMSVEQIQHDLDKNLLELDPSIDVIRTGPVGGDKTMKPQDMGELKSRIYKLRKIGADGIPTEYDILYNKESIRGNLSDISKSGFQLKSLSEPTWVNSNEHPIVIKINEELNAKKSVSQKSTPNNTKTTPNNSNTTTNTSNNTNTNPVGGTGSTASAGQPQGNQNFDPTTMEPTTKSSDKNHNTEKEVETNWNASVDDLKMWIGHYIKDGDTYNKYETFVTEKLNDEERGKLFNAYTILIISSVFFNRVSMIENVERMKEYLKYTITNTLAENDKLYLSKKQFDELLTSKEEPK